MNLIIFLRDGGHAIVGIEDWAPLSRYTWKLHKGGYAYRSSFGKSILMHREVASRAGFLANQIDHVNLSKLDNRRVNLRPACGVKNQYNVRSRIGSTSQYKGVYWCKARRKWRAKIRHDNGVITHIGYFDNEKEAAIAYNEAASKFHGDFARLNEV